MRLKYCLSLAPSATEAKVLSGNDPVSFAPMDAIDNGLGGLSGLTDKPLSEVASGSYNFFRNGDLLLSKVTPCFENGKKAIAGGLTNDVGYATSEVFVVRPISIDPGYLNYLFSSEEFRQPAIASMTGTGGLKRVDPDAVKNFEIPVLERKQQELIADFLDQHCGRTESLISEKQKFIRLLKEKRQALISHVVTKGLDPDVEMKDSEVTWIGNTPKSWSVAAIKRLTSVQRGASPRPIDDQVYFDEHGDYAWTRIADVSKTDGELKETLQRLSSLGSSLSVKLEPESLFLSIAGTVGKPCITKIKACIHDGFVYFPTLRKVRTKFLFYVFQSGEPYKGLGKMGTQLNLNTETVGSIKISFPGLEEQDEIVRYIEDRTRKINKIITETKNSITLLKEHRTALISAAVTGKIGLRDKEVA